MNTLDRDCVLSADGQTLCCSKGMQGVDLMAIDLELNINTIGFDFVLAVADDVVILAKMSEDSASGVDELSIIEYYPEDDEFAQASAAVVDGKVVIDEEPEIVDLMINLSEFATAEGMPLDHFVRGGYPAVVDRRPDLSWGPDGLANRTLSDISSLDGFVPQTAAPGLVCTGSGKHQAQG